MPLTQANSRESRNPSPSISVRESGWRRIKRRLRSRDRLLLESLECRCLLAGTDPVEPPGPPWIDPPWGIVDGTKWEDANANGRRDEGERGLSGVTIYADLNWNGVLDDDEPRTATQEDLPETDFDESGHYSLTEVPAGIQSIREVVPDGYRQTFPKSDVGPWPRDPGADPRGEPGADADDDPLDEESTTRVQPALVELSLVPGQIARQRVSISIEPVCIRAVPIDVVANDPSVRLVNRTGVQVNGCGGDVSRFELAISVDQTPTKFEIQFIDSESNSVLDSIPVYVHPGLQADGGHRVQIVPGGGVGEIDFGNRLVPRGAIEGYKWLDSDGNGQWDDSEVGLGGVTVYIDANDNGQWDRGETRTVTDYENPDTDFDEGGRFYLGGLDAGEYVVREIVPPGFVQTFPAPDGSVLRSASGRMNDGVAIDLNVTDVSVSAGDAAGRFDAQLDLTVVWPDSCGSVIDDDTAFTVVGQHIIVELAGHQTGEVCAEVISPEQVSVEIPGLTTGRYHVVATLHEAIPGGNPDLPTLSTVAAVMLGEEGAHRVVVTDDDPMPRIQFGNFGRMIEPPDDRWNLADLDRDGRLGIADIDLMAIAIRGQASESGARDLNGDGQLDHLDLEYLVQRLLDSQFGDVNLDGRFNSSDLVEVFQRGEYEDGTPGNSTWAEGDWNGDGEFDSSDLVLAMQHGGYEQGPAPSAVDVAFAGSWLTELDRPSRRRR